MSTAAQRIASAIRRADALLLVTGAGVSVASGLPTFRGSDPGAVWKQDVTELGTAAYFRRDPVDSWRWYLERFEAVRDAEPNPAHEAIAELEGWQRWRDGDFLLVTQNVDTLHEKAGSDRLVKVHGSADRVRCSRRGCRHGAPGGSIPRQEIDLATFAEDPRREKLPRCPECEALLRPHVLWFDEYYQDHDDYEFERILEFAARADLFLFTGTSFSVGLTEILLSIAARRRVDAVAVDPGGAMHGRIPNVEFVRAAAEDVLPEATDRLRGSPV